MSAERVAKRYAKALFDLCEGDLAKAKIYREAFGAISEIFEHEDIRKVLASPVVNSELKRKVLKDVAEQIEADRLLSLFLDSIAEANRVGVIPEISKSLHKMILKQEGIVEAEVLTVFELDDESLSSVKTSLEDLTKTKVQLFNKVDKSILGGFVVRIENSVLDMSLKTKLDAMTQSAVR
ncbi:ATP synthase F1 subunit delta [Pseudobacteriovorax antillogorgiicola]|uniref:ATP synthase subunit delta n=1 Tax=Pseudobacteriovorax antillogorgiicola TaxID=1513793 RepID=A0A1Y6B582_9BACT|nr:ATP synthase F1 subunit delta [Pseudobacteriovorax antillogorgiicola]TCS59155.1 ATP synthase F1 subcomplex delta subunit [Pseudobacteriovorax antillogorgiicola]SME91141.1 ATP synthase F1 subcomplex delta subunit [Pseudobacteriovorax antillogorgiicola]